MISNFIILQEWTFMGLFSIICTIYPKIFISESFVNRFFFYLQPL